jgi:MoaA/NifB/PqqE/SkfB family radical SAM enzyme
MFAPTQINVHEFLPVVERARALGAFRLNTGKLMRIGTAARLWDTLEPTAEQYREFCATLERLAHIEPEMSLCYIPFDMADGLRRSLEDPPATLLLLPNGWVKIAAALPHICADLRRMSLAEAWRAYCDGWRDFTVIASARCAIEDSSQHSRANRWQFVSMATV